MVNSLTTQLLNILPVNLKKKAGVSTFVKMLHFYSIQNEGLLDYSNGFLYCNVTL